MSTPSKGRTGVRAPFKSPLRPKTENIQLKSASPGTTQAPNEVLTTETSANTDQLKYSQERLSQLTELIAQLTAQLCQIRQTKETTIDVEHEYDTWRMRMHNYNDAKDACLELFDSLANARGCLVRQIYHEYGLQLDD